MSVLDYRWHVPDVTEEASLWFLTDQHLGNSDCALGRIKETRDMVAADPTYSRGILGGDCCDFINFTDRRFDIRQIAADFIPNLDNLAKSVSDYFIKIYAPIKDQLIGIIPGNHDETIRIKYHFDIAGYIAGVLGIPYLQQVDMLRLFVTDKQRSYEVQGVVSHAEKGSTTVGGKLAAVTRMAAMYDGIDFFAQAHTHEYLYHRMPRIKIAGRCGSGRRDEKRVMLFLTGGYLKTYGEGHSGYGAKKGYAPCELGSPRLKMHMDRTSVATGRRGGRSVDRVELSGE